MSASRSGTASAARKAPSASIAAWATLALAWRTNGRTAAALCWSAMRARTCSVNIASSGSTGSASTISSARTAYGPWRSSAAMAPFRETACSSFATRRTSTAGST